MARNAQITGEVEYREGDGVNLVIRPGPVAVNTTPTDATLGWIMVGGLSLAAPVFRCANTRHHRPVRLGWRG